MLSDRIVSFWDNVLLRDSILKLSLPIMLTKKKDWGMRAITNPFMS